MPDTTAICSIEKLLSISKPKKAVPKAVENTINDVVNAFMIILKHMSSQKNGFYEYEVGSGSNVKIKSLVKLIKELSKCEDTKLNFGAIRYRGNEIMASTIDISNLLKLGWKPQYTLESGLLKTIEFEKSLRR